tara:strand:+ start:1411 stop:1755 length:345 start_codon:yes stop_codon:yes gene_type:complete
MKTKKTKRTYKKRKRSYKIKIQKTKKKKGGVRDISQPNTSFSQFSDQAQLGPDDEDQLVKQRRERKKRSAVMDAIMQPKSDAEYQKECEEKQNKDMEKITKWLDQQFKELNVKV